MSFKFNPNWLKAKINGSSQIKEIALNTAENRLYVVFHNNSVYSYENVSYDEYIKFKTAPSAGKYFHASIKSSKTSTKQSNGAQEL